MDERTVYLIWNVVRMNDSPHLSQLPSLYSRCCSRPLEYRSLGLTLQDVIQRCRPYVKIEPDEQGKQRLTASSRPPPKGKDSGRQNVVSAADVDRRQAEIFEDGKFHSNHLVSEFPEITCVNCLCISSRLRILPCGHLVCEACVVRNDATVCTSRGCTNPGRVDESVPMTLTADMKESILECPSNCLACKRCKNVKLKDLCRHFFSCSANHPLHHFDQGRDSDCDLDSDLSADEAPLQDTANLIARAQVTDLIKTVTDARNRAPGAPAFEGAAFTPSGSAGSAPAFSAPGRADPVPSLAGPGLAGPGLAGPGLAGPARSAPPTASRNAPSDDLRGPDTATGQYDQLPALDTTATVDLTATTDSPEDSAPQCSTRTQETGARCYVYKEISIAQYKIENANSKFKNASAWSMNVRPGTAVSILRSRHNTVYGWCLVRKVDTNTVGWIPTLSLRKPLESFEAFARRISRKFD
ncbi:hypothetical protein GNI_135050 [Gregarina niphandrodes]|uniref:Uncharacterized protein n=1 Tax=Gregarina niphandrodes TaxID=110365 RepID=A0A023B117_GRENI|nr:hypothetical protein GNI_135050 [Gregarina niphandrodes]EZG46107.1 hypothetical protein GNI_135050 [Gregarina niphandrodes]|eukprot:XP_011132363.1 hypothetical protein GNI_135050 [Gregarina niphandrodes]